MTTYSTAVLANSPLFYYRMEEASGALVNSGSAGGTVTKIGSPTWATGADGRGFSFSGSDGFSVATSNDFTNGKTFAVEALIKITSGQNTGYNTIVRRDTGSAVFLMRVRGTDLGTDIGKLEVYVSGSGGSRTLVSTARVDDGNWHHVLFTVSSSSVIMYIDGTLITSGSTPGGSMSTTSTIYIGQNPSGAERYKGTMDEVAIYNSSDGTTLATHAGVSRTPVAPNLDVTVNASPATMSMAFAEPVKRVFAEPASMQLSMPDVAVTTNRNAVVSVSAMTLSQTAPDAIGAGNLVKFFSIADASSTVGGGSGTSTSIAIYNTGAVATPSFKFATPTATVEQATLVIPFVTNTLTVDKQVYVRRWGADWDESSSYTTLNNLPVAANLTPAPIGLGIGVSAFTFDVTSLMQGYYVGTFANYGIGLSPITAGSGNGSAIVGTRENADINLRPYVLVKYFDGSKTVSVSPMNMSQTAPDVVVTKQTRVDVSPMTISHDFVLPTFTAEVTPNVNLSVEPMNMSIEMPGGVFTRPVNVSVAPLELNTVMTDVTVTSFINAIPVIAPMRMSHDLIPPTEAGNITEDRYFDRIIATTDDDDYIGFGSTTGFRRFVGGSGTEGTAWSIVGTWNNAIFGPESRRAIHLSDAYVNNDSNKPSMFEWTFETVLRTTDANGTLISGLDISGTSSAQYSIDIALNGGKISVAKFTQSVIGRNRIDDGEWHHVLVTFGGGTGINTGLRVFIDGQLDIRRELFGVDSTTSQWAGPDRFFGNLDADVESFIFRRSADMNDDAIVQNYYAAIGIYPIAVAPMNMSVAMPNARGKGNQKRALMLYFPWRYDRDAFGNFTVARADEASYGFNRFPGDFEFGPNLPITAPSDFAGYKVFPVNANGGYRDEITDFPRLIDLEKDLNIDDYDIIFFRNWPNEGVEIDALAGLGVTVPQLEKLLVSVRWAVDQGKGFLITDPGLADAFGVVQSATAVPVMGERDFVDYQGNAAGDYDRRAYDVDPWRVPANAQFPADYRAHFYRDTHMNNRERVAATIAGLTDIPSYILADWTIRDERDPFKLGGIRSLKYEQKNALAIGDEFVNLTVPAFQAGTPDPRGSRRDYVWAVPPSGIKAGKAVTTLGNTIFNGGIEVVNPYAGWATTIAIEPGDSLNGRPIGGKVFVNIAEELYNDGIPEPAKIQLVPDNSNIPNPADHEDADKRAWQYSMNRWDIGYTSPGGGSGGSSNQEGSVDAGAGKTGNWSPDLAGVSASEKYPTQDISIHTMMSRGLVWLGVSEEREPGDAVVRPAAMIVGMEMKQPGTTAQRPAIVNVPAMVMNVQMVNPVEARDGNVEIRVIPMEMSLSITGYNKRIGVSPMEMSIEMVDNFNLVFAGGEQVVLVLHNVDAILTIEEGT